MVFPFKVSEVVLMGRHPYLSAFTFEGDEDIEIARSAMERTQTIQFSQRNFNEISGGEKQRVVIAGAITQEPELMILDEPTSALDIKYQIQILNILKQLNESEKMTVILAMHDLHLASKFCSRNCPEFCRKHSVPCSRMTSFLHNESASRKASTLNNAPSSVELSLVTPNIETSPLI